MEGDEIFNFVRAWITVTASLCYCYVAAKMIDPGVARLTAFLPVISLFIVIPMSLTTVFLCGTTSFFVSWLATFKLALFAFAKGPLTSHSNPLPLRRFLLLACFPIKIQNQNNTKDCNNSPKQHRYTAVAVKVMIYATNFLVHRIKDHIHPKLFVLLFSIYTYITVEFILEAMARLVRAWLGVEIDPQFNEPYLSTSLQDFWGKRWNMAASRVLHSGVYEPVRAMVGPLAGVFLSYLASGLMHELVFLHLGRQWPTWDVTWFFALHGVCVAAEICAKRRFGGRWRILAAVSGILTVGFVMATTMWLFWPALMRFDAEERGNRELLVVIQFLWNMGSIVFDFSLSVCRRFTNYD